MRTDSKEQKALLIGMALVALAFGGWATACLISAWGTVGFSVTGLMGSWATAIGTPVSLVEYYTQIKGIEYIVCASFLALFPVYFKFVNKAKTAKLTA